MTQPDKTKVLPDKLLTNEMNKQLNINSKTDSASNNENMVTMHETEKNVYTDVDCHLVRDVVLSLLDLHLTNVNVSNTSKDNSTDVSINVLDSTNLPDFSIVDADLDKIAVLDHHPMILTRSLMIQMMKIVMSWMQSSTVKRK